MPAAARTSLEVAGKTLSISNLDKVLWPRDAFTKGDLIAYYRAVAPYIVPYLRGRPLTLERFPDGIDGEAWWEKNAHRGLPAWIPTIVVPSSGGRHDSIAFMVCNDEPSLVYVANLAGIVLHVWTSKEPKLDVPDFILFDLDPWEGCTLANLATVAVAFRDALLEIGLQPLVKTTGGSGFHVLIPLQPRYDYDLIKGFGELIARRIHGLLPERTTLERMTKKRPAGTVYLDWVQVGKGKTLVAPFSVRARDGAPVSMPLDWKTVDAMCRKRAKETETEMLRWTIANVPHLLATSGDPWAEDGWRPQRLEAPLKKARSLWA